MKSHFLGTSALALVAAFHAGQARAQEFYIGAGFESLRFEITQGDPGYVEDNDAVALLFGVRGNLSDTIWWAGEFDYSKTVNSDLDFPNPSRAMRVRGLLGYDFGAFEAFGAIGVVRQTSDYADFLTAYGGEDTESGMTLGLGVQYQFTPKISGRLEYIHDTFEKEGVKYHAEWETNTVRAAAIFTF